MIDVMLDGVLSRDTLERAALDLITYTPLEGVVRFRAFKTPIVMANAHIQLPNLRALTFDDTPLSVTFPNSYLVFGEKVFPSLEHVQINFAIVDDGDWSPLVTFLAGRMSSGNRLDTLVIDSSPYICPEMVEDIRGMVRELRLENQHEQKPTFLR